MAQNKEDIVGLYSLGSHSPEGGSHLFVLENGKFVITYFGGVQVGQWKKERDHTFLFTPNVKTNQFELYGRHNKNIKDSLKISFMGFEESQNFVGLKKTKDDVHIMKQVFNEDANCFNYPYVEIFKKHTDIISFMTSNEEMKATIIDFDTKNFNDFIAYFFPSENEAYPFYAKLKENKLYLDENEYSEKHPLPAEGEDIEFIRAIANKNTSEDKIFCNPSYNKFEGNINDSYVFNKEKEAYIHPDYYTEGDEFKEDTYDNLSIIYEYQACTNDLSKNIDFKIEDKPIFQVNCR
ncbi:hypothetical protein ATE84_1151 [Aquimarina sp. MAR_2010_214]|nr:hypothetical protein ATE84_1151 [Aquimarina sp. MAR_2010_214]